MRQQLFKGTGVATITPFLENGKIDYTALEKIIEYQIEGGVDYIVSLGTTGEAVTLSSKECREVFDFTIKICLLYTSPSPRDRTRSRMPSSA